MRPVGIPLLVFVGLALSAWTLPSRRLPIPGGIQTITHKPVIEDGDELVSTAEQTMQYQVDLLQRGRQFLQSQAGYTAHFTKQEVVSGELLDEQSLFLKCRHQPFSVYLRWITGEPGREVIYREGANDGNIIAHGGGWKARLPTLFLSPESSLAMKDSRYPVTAAGLLGLLEILLAHRVEDLSRSNIRSCQYEEDSEFTSRPCHAFVTYFKSREASPLYRKLITLIDREWNVPLYTRNYGWPHPSHNISESELDRATLIEAYGFSDIDFHQSLSDEDFDRENKEYQFR